MKKLILSIALLGTLATTVLSSCRSDAEKEAAAQSSVLDAQENLAQVQ